TVNTEYTGGRYLLCGYFCRNSSPAAIFLGRSAFGKASKALNAASSSAFTGGAAASSVSPVVLLAGALVVPGFSCCCCPCCCDCAPWPCLLCARVTSAPNKRRPTSAPVQITFFEQDFMLFLPFCVGSTPVNRQPTPLSFLL